MPNPELATEAALAESTPAEFAQLEAEKEMRRERFVRIHPWLAKLLRVRLEPSGDDAPPLDEESLRRVAAELDDEFPHGEHRPQR